MRVRLNHTPLVPELAELLRAHGFLTVARGPRPQAPRPVPRWYWRWAGWQLQPLRIAAPRS